MRFFKIIVMCITTAFMCAYVYFVYLITKSTAGNAPTIAYAFVIAIGVSLLVTLGYQYKSYQFYRKKENIDVSKKISKTLWIGSIVFNCLLIFVGGIIAYELLIYRIGFMDWKQFVLFCGLISIGGIGILEVSLLKKRITRLKAELNQKEEIESIGD